jgi:uncharacterized protein YggE
MKKILVFIVIAFISFSSFAQMCDQIVIEGKSSVKMAPEQYIFNVRISVSDSNYTACANLALEEAEKITKEFTKNGIDKDLIKTLNYSIREVREHDYKTNKSVFKGYQAEIPLRIKTHINYDKNDVIFEIIKNNFEANFNLNFELTPEQTEAIKEKLIALAVEDAKQKAKVVAESAGIRLGKISKIQYGEPKSIAQFSNSNYELQKETIMIRGAASIGGTSILNPSEIEMSTSILVSWRIED